MAKLRVCDLAKQLGVTSKTVLEKCRAEGLELKNHMAALSAGLEATIREWFSEGGNVTAVETAQHVDLEEAHKEAKKARRRRSKKAEAEEAALAAQQAAAEAEAAAIAEKTAAAAPPVAIEDAPAPAAEEAAGVKAPAEAVEAAEAPKVVEEQQPPAPPAEKKGKARYEPVKPKPPEVKPAGPQVVPRPARLRGPQVVRVEKPDVLPSRPPARGPLVPVRGPAGAVKGREFTAGDEEEEGGGAKGKKKAKRRSPRRRAGRSADSGEKLKEWRDQDLQERSARLAAAGAGLRRHRTTVAKKSLDPAAPSERVATVEIQEPITVKKLSAATGIKTAEIIKKLMQSGMMVTANQTLNRETAEAAVADYDLELVVKAAKTAQGELLEKLDTRAKAERTTRAPVVTFLGHVDHGKTSLLDRIRHTQVADGEAGGITQHIGAYRYDKDNLHVVFLDTPGHEAFTAMRSRGANMTDVVVLVVAADDGVMPQTEEALSHARAAGVPIVVALNKVDLPNANIPKAMGQLAEHDLHPREWGGNIEVIQTSAATGAGIDVLVETLSLEAELLELKAEFDAPASGFVIEARMDPGLGVTANLLVRNGTLKVGNVLLAGGSFGRVRQMTDDRGRTIEQAGPSTPVAVSGLDAVPKAGDRFYVTQNIDQARTVATEQRQAKRFQELAVSPQRTLEDLLGQIKAGEAHELALILKADVQGSIEALVGSLEKLSTDEVRVKILHSGVGGISTGDVSLAEASKALIIGFNVVADSAARQLAESAGVEFRVYRIIYEVIEDVRRAMEEGLAPEIRVETLGRAEVRQVFKISRYGTVAGCYVTDGLVSRSAKVRITRNNVVVEDNRSLESLKRFKDDAREVRAGLECGLRIAGYEDVKEGDVLEFYKNVEVARTL